MSNKSFWSRRRRHVSLVRILLIQAMCTSILQTVSIDGFTWNSHSSTSASCPRQRIRKGPSTLVALPLTNNPFASSIGDSILDQVQWIDKYQNNAMASSIDISEEVSTGAGVGRGVYSGRRKWRRQAIDKTVANNQTSAMNTSKEAPVWEALANLENDSAYYTPKTQMSTRPTRSLLTHQNTLSRPYL